MLFFAGDKFYRWWPPIQEAGMNGTLIMMAIAEQHRHDLHRQAAHLRLVKLAHVERPMTHRCRPALAWLGEQLIAWGWRLRVRYGAIEHVVKS